MPNDILKGLADNPALLEATKELLLKQFEFNETLDTHRTNQELGEIVRARLEGVQKIRAAFREIELLRSSEPRKQGENPAR